MIARQALVELVRSSRLPSGVSCAYAAVAHDVSRLVFTAGAMRAGSGVFAAVAASIALMMSACSSSAPTPAQDLFLEYTKSTNVKNDKFASGGTSEDRLATFAAYYTPEQLQSTLLSAFPCDADADCTVVSRSHK